MSFALQATFGLYILVLIAIGVYFFATSEMKRLSEYMLADRDVGVFPIGISEAASVASGWTFFAWVGTGFVLGLNGLWFAFFLLLAMFFLYRVMGSRFRRQSEELDSLTITDHISKYFEKDPAGVPIRLVATFSILVFFGAYVGAQLIAVGEALDTGVGVPYLTGVLVGGVAIAIYTSLGGFSASIWTDFVQGLLIIFTAIALPIVAIMEIGGWSAFVAEANAVDPGLLSHTGGLTGMDLLLLMLIWLTFGMAAIGQPHSLMRFQAIRSERILSAASVVALTFQAIRMTIPLLVGIAGRVLYEDIADPEAVAMEMLVDLFPAVIAGLLLAGIVSAIISTSDSMIIVAASDVTRFYENYVNPDAAEGQLVLLGRAIVVAFALIGIGLAWMRPGTIFDIILFAFVGLGVTFGLPLLAILFWERVTGWGVFAAVFTGLAASIGHAFYVWPDGFPILVWPVAVAALVIVSYLTTPTEPPVDVGASPADD